MVKRISYGKVVESVLDVFAEILISTKWSYLPNPYFALGKSIKYLLKYKKLKKKQISKALHDLKERKIIDIVEEDGKAKISLLEKGRYKVFTRSIYFTTFNQITFRF